MLRRLSGMTTHRDDPGGDDLRPDLDLDQGPVGAGPATALFRARMAPFAGARLDLPAVERRARAIHRRRRILVSAGLGTAAAVVVAAIVLTPLRPAPSAQIVPAGPTATGSTATAGPSGTDSADLPSAPDVSKASLLRTADLAPGPTGVGALLGGQTLTGHQASFDPPYPVMGICRTNALDVLDPPTTILFKDWQGGGTALERWSVSEFVAQWPEGSGQTTALMKDLREQLADCSSPPPPDEAGLTSEVVPEESLGLPTLFTTFTENPSGTKTAKGWVVLDDTVLEVQVGAPVEATQEEAGQAVLALALPAVARVLGVDPDQMGMQQTFDPPTAPGSARSTVGENR